MNTTNKAKTDPRRNHIKNKAHPPKPAPFFLDQIFNDYRKYQNYVHYVRTDLL